MTDLVLVNPNGRNGAPFAAIEPPFWLGLIAGSWRRKFRQIWIVDAEVSGLTVEETIKEARAKQQAKRFIIVMGNNPSVSSTPKMVTAEKIQRGLPGSRFMGLHPRAVNDSAIFPFSPEEMPSVPWEMFDLSKYRAHNWHCLDDVDKRSPYAVLYTSLNCPHDCFYCNVHTLYGDRKVRYRPMADVKRELDYFAKKGIRNLKIWDECGFTMNKERAREICDYIIANEYDFNMWCYSRLDSADPVMLSRMWMAGIRWVAYGFETTTDKKTLTADMAIQVTKECGLNIIANFMFGLPGETSDQRRATLDFALSNNFEWANFQVALPYPGSAWWDSLKEKPMDWARFGQFHPNMYGEPEAIAFRQHAFRSFFTRPEYQDTIGIRFGDKAQRHIQEMLKWQPPIA